MTTSDPTTQGDHIDYRIGAISDALMEHRHSWATIEDNQVTFDTDLLAIIAVAAIEESMEADEFTGRICRHVCHEAEREDNIKAIRTYAEQVPEYKVLVEQLVLMIRDEAI